MTALTDIIRAVMFLIAGGLLLAFLGAACVLRDWLRQRRKAPRLTAGDWQAFEALLRDAASDERRESGQ